MPESFGKKIVSYWPIIIFVVVLIAGAIVVKETVKNNADCLHEMKVDLNDNVKPKVTSNRENLIRLEQNYSAINEKIKNVETTQNQMLSLQQEILHEVKK